MQTLAFLCYELEAAKRHIRETLAEPEEFGQVYLPVRAETQWTGIKSLFEGVLTSSTSVCADRDFCRSSNMRARVGIPIAKRN